MGITSPFLKEPFSGISSPFINEGSFTVGGAFKSVGAGLLAGATFLPQTAVSGVEVIEDLTGLNLGGEKMDAIVDNAVDFWRKRIGKSKAEQIIGQAAETIGALGTTAAIAPQNLLGVMSAGAGLERTAEELELGTPRLNAYGAGFVQAGTEYLTEKIPIGKLQKPGLSFLKRLAGGAVFDVPGELLATATEMKVIEEGILGRKARPTEEFVQALKDTAMVSILSTIGLTGGAQLLDTPQGIDLESAVKEATGTIEPLKEPRRAVQIEKQEFDPLQVRFRVEAKSEYPELASQTNSVNSEEQVTPRGTEIRVDVIPTQNIHETEPFKNNTYAEVLEEAETYSRKQRSLNGGKLWASFVRNFVDVSGNVKKKLAELGNDGLRVVAHRNAQAGATPKAHKELNIARKEIFSGFNSNERKLFNGYLSGLRDLELRRNRGINYKLRGNATERMIRDYIDAIPEKYITKPDGSPGEFVRRQKIWSQRMGDVLNLLESEGLLTTAQNQKLRSEGEFYVPKEILEFVDPLVQSQTKDGRAITVRDSGLKNLSEDGSDKLAEVDAEFLLKQVYERTYTRIFKNRANQEMLKLAILQPNNGVVRQNKIKKFTKDGQPVFADIGRNEARISVMVAGQRQELVMPAELAQEWVKSDPILSATMSTAIGWASGNKILKSMATTLNPEFAITNIPRDLAHIYLTTQEYSSIAPIAALQMHNDLRKIAVQAIKAKGIKKTDLYKQYIDNGGGTEFLTYQGKTGIKGTTNIKRVFTGLESVMSSAGEFSEIVTRLALMKRAMDNGKTPFEATQIARGYLDFSQGGSVTKALDAGIPFLNAAVQATRGITRAFAENPAVAAVKFFNIGSVAMSLYWANKFMYGDEVEDVTDNEQKNNFIVFTPWTFKDEDGNERHYYIRIPKDQGQRAVASIFEGFAKKSLDEPVDEDQIIDAIKDFSPVSFTDIPPVVEAVLGYSVNKDFWRREDIWKGDDVLPQEEYNKYTPETYVQFGEQTGTSPVRMKYALEQLFTRGNIWTSLAGYGAKQIMDELTPEQRLEETKALFERKPFVRRILRSTRPQSRREKEIKEEKVRISTERLRANRQLDALVEAEAIGRTDKREINDFIRRFPVPERNRLRRRRKSLRSLRGVRNRGFWFDLMDLPPESRAVNYWNRWQQLDAPARRLLDRESRKVPGFRSKRFNRTFNKMKRMGGR
jgi:hypothetical protein